MQLLETHVFHPYNHHFDFVKHLHQQHHAAHPSFDRKKENYLTERLAFKVYFEIGALALLI